MERLEADVRHLASLTRGSASAGERESAAWIASRLRELGSEGEVERYRGRGTYAWSYAALAFVGLLRSWAASLAALVALELDASGRFALPLGTGEGANVIGRVGPAGETVRTLVLVAHHDTQRTGWVWDPRLHEPGAARRLRTRSIPPYLPPAGLALLLHRTRIGRALLLLLGALSLQQARGRPVPGANDNATGVAAVLELARRWIAAPLDGVEVLAVFPGGEESGMQGMRAFLRSRSLDPATTLVLCLDTLGCGTPIVLRAEHTLLPHRYAEADLALVPADVEHWSLGGWTDALQAKLAGLRTISLLSIGPLGILTHYHRPDDVPENVDFASVRACVAAAVSIAEAFAAGG